MRATVVAVLALTILSASALRTSQGDFVSKALAMMARYVIDQLIEADDESIKDVVQGVAPIFAKAIRRHANWTKPIIIGALENPFMMLALKRVNPRVLGKALSKARPALNTDTCGILRAVASVIPNCKKENC